MGAAAAAVRVARPLVAILAILALLAACSVATSVRVFNDTGQTIGLRLSIAGTKFERTVWLDQGDDRLIYAPEFIVAPGKTDMLPIYHGRCRYEYEVPKVQGGYFRPGGGTSVNVQVDPGLSLFLLPVDARARVARTQLAKAQPAGFPMRPVSRTCG